MKIIKYWFDNGFAIKLKYYHYYVSTWILDSNLGFYKIFFGVCFILYKVLYCVVFYCNIHKLPDWSAKHSKFNTQKTFVCKMYAYMIYVP